MAAAGTLQARVGSRAPTTTSLPLRVGCSMRGTQSPAPATSGKLRHSADQQSFDSSRQRTCVSSRQHTVEVGHVPACPGLHGLPCTMAWKFSLPLAGASCHSCLPSCRPWGKGFPASPNRSAEIPAVATRVAGALVTFFCGLDSHFATSNDNPPRYGPNP